MQIITNTVYEYFLPIVFANMYIIIIIIVIMIIMLYVMIQINIQHILVS